MKSILIGILKLYKKALSPFFSNILGNACRFTPTCSEYTIEALEKFGSAKGVWVGIKRVARCHPLGGSGYDPLIS